MNSSAITFVPSDAWLLYSVIHASKETPSTLEHVVAVGDYYNHAVFTADELNGGFDRLIPSGWVVYSTRTYAASKKALEIYRQIQKRKLSCYDEMRLLENALNSDHSN